MPKQTFLLTLIFTLAACAQPTPAPTATPLPPTATFTPEPTSTPSPTSTPALWQIAMQEYGMPEEQAKKLAGMNVSFERVEKYVDGVRVLDSEGKEIFYFDEQTKFLVAVDRWPQITEVSRVKENMMTEDELFSNEYFAWLKYVASNLEFNPDKVNFIPLTTFSLDKHRIVSPKPNKNVPNYPDVETRPFKREEALAYLIKPDLTEKYEDLAEPIDRYAILPIFFLVEESGEWKVKPVIITQWESESDLDEKLQVWEEEMNVTPIKTSHPVRDYPSSYPNVLVNETFERFGDSTMSGWFEQFLENGNPGDLSQPGVVLDTRLLSKESNIKDWYQ